MRQEVKLFPVPKYKELGVKNVWNFVKEIPELLQYFPEFADDDYPDRDLMWEVLGTLRKNACKRLIHDSRMARSKNEEENKNDLIEIHPEILDKLIQIPSTSKRKIQKYNCLLDKI